jgi:hypothetical protein
MQLAVGVRIAVGDGSSGKSARGLGWEQVRPRRHEESPSEHEYEYEHEQDGKEGPTPYSD